MPMVSLGEPPARTVLILAVMLSVQLAYLLFADVRSGAVPQERRVAGSLVWVGSSEAPGFAVDAQGERFSCVPTPCTYVGWNRDVGKATDAVVDAQGRLLRVQVDGRWVTMSDNDDPRNTGLLKLLLPLTLLCWAVWLGLRLRGK